MTNKERLKKQKEKQLAAEKKAAQQEQQLKDNFQESKESKKYRKKGKTSEPVYYLILKLAMLAPYAYSVVFWGGVLSVALLGGMIYKFEFSQASEYTAVWIISSAAVMAAALVFEFFRKYIAGAVLAVGGTAAYFHGVDQFIKPITARLKEVAVAPELLEMDKKWMYRCYPAAAFAVIACLLLAIKLISVFIKRRKEKLAHDNAPVKSIVSD